MADLEEKSEVERLVYVGSKVPNVIRLAWTVFIFFGLVYLVRYFWPELQHWFGLLDDAGR